MGVPAADVEVAGVSWGRTSIRSKKAIGGYICEEAIMIFHLFYITENMNAPGPKSKANQHEAST
ncbi:uncharacterized protein ARMOST_21936 [Armillaria ostoyae]|uniref:Uncharacterized protein n=1 Tax=Armillaria ostoyae TaxID=47428 RepID=A0A284SBK2_ARMOS|nr:uncharacterized protein ARMOST_21936 [Armillaria ostoyae]